MRIAIIGAGPAGLAAARTFSECSNPAFDIQVFERNTDVGGTWIYDPVPSPTASAMYANLHTNLTHDLMSFLDYPFPADTPEFPPHHLVLKYLRDFATHYNLRQFIRFHTNVVAVRKSIVPGQEPAWEVVTVSGDGPARLEVFDAVVVCNGHYEKPRWPAIRGLAEYRGELLHTRDYRTPEQFERRSVLVVGGGSSGIDIAREVSAVASIAYLSTDRPDAAGDLGETLKKLSTNIKARPEIDHIEPETGRVHFVDGSQTTESIDAIILATGYYFAFPFLDRSLQDSLRACAGQEKGLGVSNLYASLFHIPDPTLAFVGLPMQVEPFPLFQLQTQWIAQVWQGKVRLPGEPQMRQEEENEHQKYGFADGDRKKLVFGVQRQYPYWNRICDIVGYPKVGQARIDRRVQMLEIRRKALGY
ncbi:uncharacterized protein BJ171DRAFT_509132 [Polychytrium aggregatum]|uniref:uncharacterized protein n=1 Tax=Polychytrium aggregatum TaxID=110093 RepID=UPI0022FE0E5E|nr:uncharacterized protein BJ171DRAFT_509132 [Polychytrium aggregatum]KAI9203631.1 hypothetical protein BJ171DRAFT_509132 [Polychytrium aggregatum]